MRPGSKIITRRVDGIHFVTRQPELPPESPCQRARWLFRQRCGFVVWDTETTGLEDDSKIVSIGAVDQDSNMLLDLLINPGVPIPSEATDIHGITDEMVKDAPTFAQVYPQIRAALADRRWVIYNASYDMPRLWYECERYFLPQINPRQECLRFRGYRSQFPEWSYSWDTCHDDHCLMELFAEHYGDWSDYFHSYKWQKLQSAREYYRIRKGKAHNALSDAQTAFAVLRQMAWDEDRGKSNEKESGSHEME